MMGIVVVIYSSVSVFLLIFVSSVLGSSSQILLSSYKKIKNKSPLSKIQKTQIPLLLGLPLRLTIPSIHVDSSINYVGLTPEGKMDIFK